VRVINERSQFERSGSGESGELLREVVAGLVVAVATIPTSVSYSTIVGVSPLTGIWTSAIVGLCVTVVGGGPGLIAGAAGVVALPMARLVGLYGPQYMAAAVLLSGERVPIPHPLTHARGASSPHHLQE